MRSDLDQALFQCAYLLCLIDALIFGYSTFSAIPFSQELSMMLRIGAAVLVGTKLLFDRYYSVKMLISMIIVGLLLLTAYLNSGYSHVFYLLMICLGIRYVDSRRIIAFDFWMRVILCVIIVLCGLTGIIENYVTYRTNSDVLRYSIGFNHPNTVASMVLSLILEDTWINQRRASGLNIVVIWMIATITYFITANRTAVLIMYVFPVVNAISEALSNQVKGRRSGGLVFAQLCPAAALFSYIAMKLCRSSSLFRIIDYALSGRFFNASVIHHLYGMSPLGQKVSLVSVKTARLMSSSIALLDVAYLRLLIQAGPIALALLIILYGCVMNRAWSERNHILVLILVVYIFFGICESGFNNVYMNFTLLLAAKEMCHIDDEHVIPLMNDQMT